VFNGIFMTLAFVLFIMVGLYPCCCCVPGCKRLQKCRNKGDESQVEPRKTNESNSDPWSKKKVALVVLTYSLKISLSINLGAWIAGVITSYIF